eukprot:TRINITY_DN5279_c0_g1_i1.p1 TRINITY_DN5279_c0_g1~~TRINITY_DN5279_c0_g1_i1.p1  ORF type:complete len:594 (-),score=292.09 TRINITY_DN5279_c0_g1_i1:1249-3030(-)
MDWGIGSIAQLKQLGQLASSALGDEPKDKENKEDNTMELLKAEFSHRIGDLERKLNDAKKEAIELKKERDELKKNQSQPVQTPTNNNESSSASSSEKILELENQVKGLMEEGEKLSKKQLMQESIIKKLRAEKVENDNTVSMLQDRSSNSENLLEAKVLKIKELESILKKQSETIAENVAKTALLVKEAEETTRSECSRMIQKSNQEGESKESQLTQTILELRGQILFLQQQVGSSEDQFFVEMQRFKTRAEEAERKNQELVQAIPEATRPLLLQMQGAKQAHEEEKRTWENLEEKLNLRLNEAEVRIRESLERETEAVSQMNELTLQSKMFSNDLESTKLKWKESEEEKKKLNEKIRDLESQIKSLQSHIEVEKIQKERTISELMNSQKEQSLQYENMRKSKEMLEIELEETKKRLELSHSSKDNNNNHNNNLKNNITSPAYISNPTTPSGFSRTPSSNELFQLAFSNENNNSFKSFPMEKWQTFTKQKEGEILGLQSQKATLERDKERFQDELVRLTTQNEELSTELNGMKDIKIQMEDLKRRYETALVLIGEKEEEVEEKRQDIADMKALYKNQINDLIDQLNLLKNGKR